MTEPILTPHNRSECREAGVLGKFIGGWRNQGELGELRQCSCGRWWRCSSVQWQRWNYVSPRKVRRLLEDLDVE